MGKDRKQDGQDGWRTQTRLVRGGMRRSEFRETSEGLFLTSGYVYDSADEAAKAFTGEADHFVYSRYANPTVAMFEERLALLEGAAVCRGTSSGMAAVFAALMTSVRAGGRVVASRALFGACHYVITEILPTYGIESVVVDGADLDQWRAALKEGTDAVFLETPSNPMLEVIDLAAVCELAHAAGARVVVDNVFATPILQKPLELGADVVVYSATKHIDGQGRCLGGAILTNETKWVDDRLTPFLRNTGPALSPFNAWVFLKGMETLALRVERQAANALAVAEFLLGLEKVGRVFYPGLPSHPQHAVAQRQMAAGGTLVTFDAGSGREDAFRFLDSLKLIDISNNLGDAKSLITHPVTTTHQKVDAAEKARQGILESTVRLSVGLEDVEDLKEDLAQALAKV